VKVINLSVQDYKRVVAVEIVPSGNVVEIAGKNAQGKTSTLDALMVAFMGKEAIPQEPVRTGAEKAVIEVDVGDYIIRRTIKPDRTGTISISTKDGAKFASPQKMLDDLVGEVAFDPLFIVRQDPLQQLETVKGFAPKGVDFAALDAAEKEAFDARTDANREVKRLQAIVASLAAVEELPPEADVASITDELTKANERNDQIRTYAGKVKTAQAELAILREREENNRKRRADIEAEINLLQAERTETETRMLELGAEADAVDAKLKKAKPVPDLLDVSEITTRLQAAQAANSQRVAAVAKSEQAKTDRARLVAAEKKAATFDAAVEDARKARADALQSIKLPVDGLGVGAGGITFNGHPLAQASFAQQLQLGIALAIKANPKLRVARILEASMLDDDAMQTLHDMAAEHDFQIWIERVGSGSEGAIVIEAGEVKEAAPKKAKAK